MNAFLAWIDTRLPVRKAWQSHASQYYVPKNLNIWYIFGVLSLLVLFNQVLTGIWLTMFYVPTAQEAFNSIEYIMRDVSYGWLLRYMHTTGASAFFIVMYLHMFRGLLYGSYQQPRELVWLIGMGLFLLLMLEAFCGYLLPWGQMSFWAAQVITSLLSVVPVVGTKLVIWLRGDYSVSTVTLQRFFALHVAALPLLVCFGVYLHVIALHQVGSNNPEGIDIKNDCDAEGHPLDAIPLHPYFTVKDLLGIIVFLMIFFSIVCFFPEMGGYFLERTNFIPADPMVTPNHIAPVWYFTPFYAMLRAIPDKLWGVSAMLSSLILFFCIPWLDRSPVRSMRYKGRYSRIALGCFVVSVILLGYLGTLPVTYTYQCLARVGTGVYFAYFILMPWYTRLESCGVPPKRILR
ncbi:MAG: cytochrome b N-terminal domain-containing protein [Legionellaceae bacterium]|nr:cytochrome b N-terminal domain-containing protein [Legionellaceae bacterium]